ncbi:MAG: hypothetical protein ACI8PB_002380, partial [Desulforhopalus sp.]
EKKTLFEKLFFSPNLLRLEKTLFQTSTILGVIGKSTLESEEPYLLNRIQWFFARQKGVIKYLKHYVL